MSNDEYDMAIDHPTVQVYETEEEDTFGIDHMTVVPENWYDDGEVTLSGDGGPYPRTVPTNRSDYDELLEE